MTKWFTYFEDHPVWTMKEFYEYFEGIDTFEVFTSFLKTSYEMTAEINNLWKVEAVVCEGVGEYRIVFKNGWSYPAGKEKCTCTDELLYGFLNRINDPNKYTERT